MRIPMDVSVVGLVGLLGISSLVTADGVPVDPAKGCKTNPALVGECFSVRARVSVYSGTPAVRIAPVNSKRLLGVIPSENEIMPSMLKAQLSPDQDVYADLLVCPFSKQAPKQMQFVCIESAENVKVGKR